MIGARVGIGLINIISAAMPTTKVMGINGNRREDCTQGTIIPRALRATRFRDLSSGFTKTLYFVGVFFRPRKLASRGVITPFYLNFVSGLIEAAVSNISIFGDLIMNLEVHQLS